MNKKKLLIIHSEKKINIEEKGVSYINIGGGVVESRASKKITLNQFRKTFYQKYKKLLIQKLSNKANIAEKKFPHVNELEIFNLRNDKNTNIDLILNTLIIGEIIEKKNFTKIELITDNSYVNKIFKDAFPFIEIRYSKKNITKFNLTFLKILKFYIKTLSVIIYLKIFYRQKKITKVFKEACLSLYPIFYKSNNESFFNDNNKIKFNFLLTDETHLNFSLLDITKAIKKNKNSESVHVESFISFKSLFYSMCKSIFFYFISFKLNFNLRLKNLDLSFFYKDYFFSSLINRCKLNIYEDSFLLALKKFNIKRFNLYLFEYNFGFFLTNLIKKKIKDIDIVGYQHGIFSNQLFWLDIILRNKKGLNYLPKKIKAFNSVSYKDYKSKINSKKIKFTLLNKKKSPISLQCKKLKKIKNLDRILVLPGTHDANSIFQAVKEKIFYKKDKIKFYIKFHPKKVLSFKSTNSLKVIKSIKNKNFSKILISPTSTLVYDFMNLNKDFMVYNLDYKQNLVSSNFKRKIKLYYF